MSSNTSDTAGSTDFAPLLEEVNFTDVAGAIRLALGPMQHWFDWEHGGLPFFGNTMSGPTPGNTHHTSFSMSHIPGRWLGALLNAEDVLGEKVDEAAVANLRHWLVRSLDNRMGLPACLNLSSFEAIPVSDLHNLREVMHGLSALCLFRGDEECTQLGDRLIATVDRYLDFETGDWDEERFYAERGGRTFYSAYEVVAPFGIDRRAWMHGQYFPRTFGRYLGAVVHFYIATGSQTALTQALRLGALLVNRTFRDATGYDVTTLGPHTHSVTSSLSGLARLAAVTNDVTLFDHLERILERLIPPIATDFGWCTEGYNRTDAYGEINNSADLVECYLKLALAGRQRFFLDAEKIVRSHILPSQLRDTRFIKGANAEALSTFSRGAFGFPCPYGLVDEAGGWISFNWDITGGGVSGLCEVLRAAVTTTGNGVGETLSVNMPFDGSYHGLSLSSPYRDGGALRLTTGRPCSLRIRLFDWCSDAQLTSASDDNVRTIALGDWLYVTGANAGTVIDIACQLRVSETTYAIKSEKIEAIWAGAQINRMKTERTRPLRFIPPATTELPTR